MASLPPVPISQPKTSDVNNSMERALLVLFIRFVRSWYYNKLWVNIFLNCSWHLNDCFILLVLKFLINWESQSYFILSECQVVENNFHCFNWISASVVQMCMRFLIILNGSHKLQDSFKYDTAIVKNACAVSAHTCSRICNRTQFVVRIP